MNHSYPEVLNIICSDNIQALKTHPAAYKLSMGVLPF